MKLYHGDRAEQHIVRKRGAFVDAYMKPRNQNRQRKKTCPNSHIRKRKVAFSIDRLRAFKRRLLSIDLDATQGENAYMLTLRPAQCITPETLKTAITTFTRSLTRRSIPWIYCVEWAAFQDTLHLHMIVKVPDENTARDLLVAWVKRQPYEGRRNLIENQDVRFVYSFDVLSYLTKGKTKLKEFNARAEKSPYDWLSVSVWASSSNWATHASQIITPEAAGYFEVRRTQLKLEASKAKRPAQRRRIQRTLADSPELSHVKPIIVTCSDKTYYNLQTLALRKAAEVERREALQARQYSPKAITLCELLRSKPLLLVLRKARLNISRERRMRSYY